MVKISVVISYYKSLENLELVLDGFQRQSEKEFEVIIAEDDNNPETSLFLNDVEDKFEFPIQHLSQESDDGFRKNEMLNRAIMSSVSDEIVFIDGDCIPHKHFIKEYIRNFEAGKMMWGRRVALGEETTAEIRSTKNDNKLNYWSLLSTDSWKMKDGFYSPSIPLTFKTRGLMGCNWGIKKQHLLEINGFDEDYTSPGVGEDHDIEWRLEQNGIGKKSMKNKAIVYHLWHPRSYSEDTVQANYVLFESKKKAGAIECSNGIRK